MLAMSRRSGHGHGAARYIELSEAEETRSRPRAALAAEPGYEDPKIVRDLLAAARRAQLLLSNGQGTRGGKLTPRAIAILEQGQEPSTPAKKPRRREESKRGNK
jgi:hypothetical protein